MINAKGLKKILISLTPVPLNISWKTRTRASGERQSPFLGTSGFDFSDIRPFEQFPDARRVNWRQSERAGTLLVNVFEETKKADIVVIADVSRSMLFDEDSPKNLMAASLAATIAYSAWGKKDRFGFAAFNGGIQFSLRPQISSHHHEFLARYLLDTDNFGKGHKGLNEALWQIMSPRALVFIISDFLYLDELPGFKSDLVSLGCRHEIIPLIIRHPLEKQLPEISPRTTWRDLETGEKIKLGLDAPARKRFQETMSLNLESVIGFLKAAGLYPFVFYADEEHWQEKLIDVLGSQRMANI